MRGSAKRSVKTWKNKNLKLDFLKDGNDGNRELSAQHQLVLFIYFFGLQMLQASMKDTIERLKIQVTTLAGKEEAGGGGENVERLIVDQASHSLAKLSQLLTELKQYQTEREVMRKQIRNLTEALKDSQSAASCKGE